MELEEVQLLVDIVRRHLLPDVPPNQENDKILQEEASLLLNLVLTGSSTDIDLTHDYLEELEWLDEISEALESIWHRREWRVFFPMNLYPNHFHVTNVQGLTLVEFKGGPCVPKYPRFSDIRKHLKL